MDIRRLTTDDAAAVLRLAGLAGWNQTAADVTRLLALEPDGCFAACADGQVIGTTTTTTYGSDLAWVGMVLVDPAFRRRGVATALVETALGFLRDIGVRTVQLDATAAGQPVYERLGFRPAGAIERWAGNLGGTADGSTATGEWAAIAALDRLAFGADRERLITCLIEDGPCSPVIARGPGGEVTGYALARPGARAGYVGPVVADVIPTARTLLLAAATTLPRTPVYVDIDPSFPGAVELMAGLGLARQREFVRMRLGPPLPVGGPLRVFAIAGPEVG